MTGKVPGHCGSGSMFAVKIMTLKCINDPVCSLSNIFCVVDFLLSSSVVELIIITQVSVSFCVCVC